MTCWSTEMWVGLSNQTNRIEMKLTEWSKPHTPAITRFLGTKWFVHHNKIISISGEKNQKKLLLLTFPTQEHKKRNTNQSFKFWMKYKIVILYFLQIKNKFNLSSSSSTSNAISFPKKQHNATWCCVLLQILLSSTACILTINTGMNWAQRRRREDAVQHGCDADQQQQHHHPCR